MRPKNPSAVYSVKSRWTLSALNLNTVGVQLERRRRLVPCFVVCLVGLFHEGVPVPVGFAVEADDPAVVHDTVDDRGGHVPVSEHVAPPAGLEVRGEDDAAGLVAVRAGLEQEPGPVDVDGQVAELADDDQPGPADRLKLLVEMVLVLGLPQSHDQARGSEEPDGDHALAGEHADRDGQVGFAAAHVAVEHEVLGPVDELQAFQLPASPVGREQGHAPGRSRPGSCSGRSRPVRAAAAVWPRRGSRFPSRTGWRGSRAGPGSRSRRRRAARSGSMAGSARVP